MSRACIVLFPLFEVPFLSMLSNSSEFPNKVVKRRSKSKSSWQGTGKTPAMISISKMETTVRTIIVNTNNALWRIMHILLNLDVWVTWKYIFVQVQSNRRTNLRFVFALATNVEVAIATVVKSHILAASPRLPLPVVTLLTDCAFPRTILQSPWATARGPRLRSDCQDKGVVSATKL